MNTTDISQKNITIARWLLRLGLAFVYGYAAVETQLNPANFLKYVPDIVQSFISVDIFLIIFGIFEILLTLWFISGKRTEYAGLISCFLMIGIILPNTLYFSILLRNVAIAFASLALFALDFKKQNRV